MARAVEGALTAPVRPQVSGWTDGASVGDASCSRHSITGEFRRDAAITASGWGSPVTAQDSTLTFESGASSVGASQLQSLDEPSDEGRQYLPVRTLARLQEQAGAMTASPLGELEVATHRSQSIAWCTLDQSGHSARHRPRAPRDERTSVPGLPGGYCGGVDADVADFEVARRCGRCGVRIHLVDVRHAGSGPVCGDECHPLAGLACIRGWRGTDPDHPVGRMHLEPAAVAGEGTAVERHARVGRPLVVRQVLPQRSAH